MSWEFHHTMRALITLAIVVLVVAYASGAWCCVGAAIVVAGNLSFIWAAYDMWVEEFGMRRSHRSSPMSPSNKQRPIPKDARVVSNELQRQAKLSRQSVIGSLSTQPIHQVDKLLPPLLKQRSKGRLTVVFNTPEKEKEISDAHTAHRRLSDQHSTDLDMDHVYVSFTDFLWAYYFIAPNAALLWILGIGRLVTRQALCRVGLLAPPVHDEKRLVGQLILESAEAIHYSCQRCIDGDPVATFMWLDIPLLDASGEFKVFKLMTVDVNLTTKSMVKATLDDRILTPSEATTLVWFDTITANHVKLHSYANWAVRTCPPSFQIWLLFAPGNVCSCNPNR